MSVDRRSYEYARYDIEKECIYQPINCFAESITFEDNVTVDGTLVVDGNVTANANIIVENALYACDNGIRTDYVTSCDGENAMRIYNMTIDSSSVIDRTSSGTITLGSTNTTFLNTTNQPQQIAHSDDMGNGTLYKRWTDNDFSLAVNATSSALTFTNAFLDEQAGNLGSEDGSGDWIFNSRGFHVVSVEFAGGLIGVGNYRINITDGAPVAYNLTSTVVQPEENARVHTNFIPVSTDANSTFTLQIESYGGELASTQMTVQILQLYQTSGIF